MYKFRLIIALFFIVCTSFNALKDNSFITNEVRKEISPFTIPDAHPIKPVLDSIFSKTRVTVSNETIRQAGFTILITKPRSHIRLLQHPDLPEYLLKVTVDSSPLTKKNKPDWHWFANRCLGAEKAAKIIKKKRLKYFVVPKKWIYVLPPNPAPPEGDNFLRKLVVLLVEDMHLIDKTTNKAKWKTDMTKDILYELYQVMHYGGGSAWRPDNVWFTTSGKLTLIDTEYPDQTAKYGNITKYLSPEMQRYWNKLIKKHEKDKP